MSNPFFMDPALPYDAAQIVVVLDAKRRIAILSVLAET